MNNRVLFIMVNGSLCERDEFEKNEVPMKFVEE
jgi:hypothetical protein